MFSLFKKPENEIAVVFDIGNGSIGAAVVSFALNHQAPTVLYTHREPLTYIPNISSKRLVEIMLKLLNTVAVNIAKEGLPKLRHTLLGSRSVKNVYCIFASPWYVSETKMISHIEDQPFIVSQSFVDGIIKKEEKNYTNRIKQGEYEKVFGETVQLLEQKIIHTKLNGYEISNPIGKKAKEIEITFFMSFIAENIIKSVESALYKAFHFKKVEFFSYSLSSWSAIRSMFPENKNFMFTDITSEVTDISLTHKGVIMETVSFPTGRSLLIREISEKLSVPPEVALSFLSMDASGNTDKAFAAKLKKVINDAGETWLKEFITTLTNLQKRYPLPKCIFITVDNDASSYFVDLLKRDVPLELNILENSLDVIYLNPSKVKYFVNYAPYVYADPFVGIESVFLSRIL